MLALFRKPALEIIRAPITPGDLHLPLIELLVGRMTLAKRRWRAIAPDGIEFGFDLREPLPDGSVFFQTDSQAYVVRQLPQPLLCVRLTGPVQGARLAWEIGNLHFSIMLRDDRLFVEDDPAIRQMFQREEILSTLVEAVFQPIAGAGHHHF